MNSVLLKNRTVLKVKCESNSSNNQVKNITNIRKEFEKSRSLILKDNVNKLLAIARSDVKEYSDLFKELDNVHKESINNFINQVKNYVNDNKYSKDEKKDDQSNKDEENIFIN